MQHSQENGEATIVGAFTAFAVRSFPANAEPFAVWLQVTNSHGRVATQLVFEHLPDSNPEPTLIVPIRFTMEFSNPNEVLEHVVGMDDGIRLEQAGLYRLRLMADQEMIMHRDFVALREGDSQ